MDIGPSNTQNFLKTNIIHIASQTLENRFDWMLIKKGRVIKMMKIFKTVEGKLTIADQFDDGTWINLVNPSEQEVLKVCKALSIDCDYLKAALDEEESSRIEVDYNDTRKQDRQNGIFKLECSYGEKKKFYTRTKSTDCH